MSFRHLDVEKTAWIMDKMLDNMVDELKNVDENDEDQTSGTERMKNLDEKGDTNLDKDDAYKLSGSGVSNAHKVSPRLYLK